MVESQNGLATRLAEAIRGLQSNSPPDIDTTLNELTAAAAASVPGAQHAGITVATRAKNVESASSTHPIAVLLDDIQGRHGEGPCLSAAWDQQIIRIDDMTTEGRWPLYCRDAMERTPIRSVLSFRLFVDHNAMGALNFYAEAPHAFGDEALEMGLLWATHTALAWTLVRRDKEFRSALATRDIIGQAKGVIMERYTVDSVQAFDMLKRLSQDSNTPLAEIAARLVGTLGNL
jgi:hypothetical protein